MKISGISTRSTTRFCKSRPLRSGSCTSNTRQLGATTRGRSKKSLADANVSTGQPAVRTSDSSDSRTEISSSTMNTIGVAADDNLDPHSNTSAEIILGGLTFGGIVAGSFNGRAGSQDPEGERLNLVVVHCLLL